jgi:hypothetical protein
MERIIHETFEGWVGETENNGEDGAREVAEERGPDSWERPVFAASNDDVEIVSKLVALSICQYGPKGTECRFLESSPSRTQGSIRWTEFCPS